MAIGSKRLVVGAHYGLREWLGQRISAVVLGVYTIGLALFALGARDLGYEAWAGLFAAPWMKIVTLLALRIIMLRMAIDVHRHARRTQKATPGSDRNIPRPGP